MKPKHFHVLALASLAVAGCASTSTTAAVSTPVAVTTPPPVVTTFPRSPAADRAAILASVSWRTPPSVSANAARLQCAPYARQRSGVQLFGEARTWWDGAAGKYERTDTPRPGAVIAMGGTALGHVAVVTRVLSSREILTDHANWLGEGETQTGALMVDASPANDWSAVYVWHAPTNSLGLRAYPVQGFIGPEPVRS